MTSPTPAPGPARVEVLITSTYTSRSTITRITYAPLGAPGITCAHCAHQAIWALGLVPVCDSHLRRSIVLACTPPVGSER